MGVDDRKAIYNAWRAHPEEWMRMSTYEEYKAMLYYGRKQKAHQLAKSAFSLFLFQQSGCKFLLHMLIELPIITQIPSNSVERPVATVLMELLNSYGKHKTTSQYQEAVRRSQQHQKFQKRLSHECWWAQYHDIVKIMYGFPSPIVGELVASNN